MITVRSSDPPWINGHIRRLIRKRKRAHKKAKRFNTPGNWRAFRKIRNDFINATRIVRESDYSPASQLFCRVKKQ